MISPLILHQWIVGFFAALARYSIHHPKRVIVIAVAVTLAVAPGALRLTLRTDGHALVSENAPAVLYDRSIREQFGIEDPVVVLIRSAHPDGIFNSATIVANPPGFAQGCRTAARVARLWFSRWRRV